MNEKLPEQYRVSANFATQLFGFFGLPAVLIGIYFVNKYSRRKLFMLGWASMSLILATIVLAICIHNGILALVCICSF